MVVFGGRSENGVHDTPYLTPRMWTRQTKKSLFTRLTIVLVDEEVGIYIFYGCVRRLISKRREIDEQTNVFIQSC